MKAFVLAAGEGTRLRPLTLALPKPMVPIANTPLLVRTLRLLAAQNIRDVAVNLFHRPEAILQSLGEGAEIGVRLRYSHEETLMGTAGGAKRLQAFLDETFLVLYGDNLYHADFAPLLAFHHATGATATIATFTAPNPSACGLLLSDTDGRVTRFQEKPPPEEVFTDQANAGVYVLEPEVLRRYVPEGAPFDFGKDVFPALLADKPGSVFARPLNGYLQDTGTIPAYRQANWDILRGVAGPKESGLAPSAQIAADARLEGDNIIGAHCAIAQGAAVADSILWQSCRIEAGASVTGAILGERVHIGRGAFVGPDAILANDVIVTPGTRVPSGARVGPGEHIAA